MENELSVCFLVRREHLIIEVRLAGNIYRFYESHECFINNNKLLKVLCCIINRAVHCGWIGVPLVSSELVSSRSLRVKRLEKKHKTVFYVMQILVHKVVMTVIKRENKLRISNRRRRCVTSRLISVLIVLIISRTSSIEQQASNRAVFA